VSVLGSMNTIMAVVFGITIGCACIGVIAAWIVYKVKK